MKVIYIFCFLFFLKIANASYSQGYYFENSEFKDIQPYADRMDFAGYMGKPVIYIDEGFAAWCYCYLDYSEDKGLRVKLLLVHFDDDGMLESMKVIDDNL